MRAITFLIGAMALLSWGGRLGAQGTRCGDNSAKIGCMLPSLGGSAFTLPNDFHRAHFSNVIQTNFTPLNSALATQLTQLPFASPASGFTLTFNSAVGVFTRTTQSFGSIMTERAETIGRGKVVIGATYQHFAFDEIDGIDLKNIPAVFLHEDDPAVVRDYEKDFITTRNSIDMKVHQFTLLGTVGVTRRFDVALAVPILDVRMGISSDATIQRVAAPDPVRGENHFFDAANPGGSTYRAFTNRSNASGIGDLTVRLKGTLFRGERSALALAGDIRFPTGDEMNFLGTGAYGFKPFLAFSTSLGRFAPHANAGFQWNGSSVLAGNLSTGAKARLPRMFSWAGGTDVGLTRRVTLAFDVIGHRVFSADRLFTSTYTSPAPATGTFQNVWLAKGSFNIVDASIGGKVNLVGGLLLSVNVLAKLNDGGLRDRFVPMVGLAKTF